MQQTRIMKKRYVIPCVLFLLSFFSCQKGLNYSVANTGSDTTSAPTKYYMKFLANGVQKQYSQQTAAQFTTLNNLYSCTLIGETTALNGAEGMTISIYNDTALTTNVVYNDGGLPVLAIPQTTFVYTDSTGSQFNSVSSSQPAIQVVFTNMTATYVTGTFSGNIRNPSKADSLSITQGSFVLPRS